MVACRNNKKSIRMSHFTHKLNSRKRLLKNTRTKRSQKSEKKMHEVEGLKFYEIDDFTKTQTKGRLDTHHLPHQ